MKIQNKRVLRYASALLLFIALSCNKESFTTKNSEVEKTEDIIKPKDNTSTTNNPVAARFITILNPGFESGDANWGDPTLFAISTSDFHSGTQSAKLSSSGDRIDQSVTVSANTDYTLTAWIFGKGSIGAKNGSTVLNSTGGTFSSWTQVTVNFNSGTATTIKLYGAYNAGLGRFDDFALEENAGTGTVPAAPSSLAAAASGSTTINLTWTDNSANETGFKLERKTGDAGTYAEITSTIAANATSYSNTGLTASTTYFYRLRSYNATGNSTYSNEISATTTTTVPAAPSGLSATASGSSIINLVWTDNSSNETGFKLERKTGSGGTYTEIASAIAANTTTYSNTGLTASTTYFYRIRSFNAAGNSSYSTETSATTSSTGGSLPANVLNLTNWKLTIPIDANGNQSGTAIEIKQPALATYSHPTYFHNNSGNTGVIFQSNTGGATTSGSGYPRSELREMTNNGADEAAWSASSGTHTMVIDEAITHLPVVKKHIVAGQIHGDENNSGPDGNDDVIVFRLEGAKLFMDHNGNDGVTLDANYVLGTRFTVKFVVSGGQIKSYYNGVLKETYTRSMSSGYFKAGAYVQSSCKSGENPGPSESCSAYGEVVVYNVTVTHQ